MEAQQLGGGRGPRGAGERALGQPGCTEFTQERRLAIGTERVTVRESVAAQGFVGNDQHGRHVVRG